jgi:hypothetical protein
MNLERIKKVFETEFNIISLTDKTNETDNVLARCCFYKMERKTHSSLLRG